MKKVLNQITVPHLSFEAFLDLAAELGCIGVEARNDMDALDRPLFDNMDPAAAGEMIRAKGLRLVGLSQVYPFNDWNDDRRAEVAKLIETAKAAQAETISLIPRNDGVGTANGERQANLRIALKEIYPMLVEADMIALVEPLGFGRSSLRSKDELIETLKALDVEDRYKLVHDTFHHTLAEGGAIYPAQTGIVHISGVSDPSLTIDDMDDAHRVLIDENDQLGNIEQMQAFIDAGYEGAFSYECFAPETQQLDNHAEEIGKSFDYIEAQLKA